MKTKILNSLKQVFKMNKDKEIKSIINIFETGKANGDYSAASILLDGAGITYGRSQSTDKSDTLDQIIFAYRDADGYYSSVFDPYLSYLVEDKTLSINPKNPPTWCTELIDLLKKAGKDPVMQKVQDTIFDEQYFVPAKNIALQMKLQYPLSLAVIYDTCIHSGVGGVANIRKRFPEVPPISGGNEKLYISAYIAARRKWLLSFSNPLVQKTIYRMDEFQKLIYTDNWLLELPFSILNVKVL